MKASARHLSNAKSLPCSFTSIFIRSTDHAKGRGGWKNATQVPQQNLSTNRASDWSHCGCSGYPKATLNRSSSIARTNARVTGCMNCGTLVSSNDIVMSASSRFESVYTMCFSSYSSLNFSSVCKNRNVGFSDWQKRCLCVQNLILE